MELKDSDHKVSNDIHCRLNFRSQLLIALGIKIKIIIIKTSGKYEPYIISFEKYHRTGHLTMKNCKTMHLRQHGHSLDTY